MKTIVEFLRNKGTDRIRYLPAMTRIGRARQWNWQTAEPGISVAAARRFIRYWNPDGCIVNNDALPCEIFAGIPTVFLHRDPSLLPAGSAFIGYDESAIADYAARELLLLHFDHYAYVSATGVSDYWNKTREKMFIKAMRINFKGVSVFDAVPNRSDGLSRLEQLSNWLVDLPKPIGVFAANDATASEIVMACAHAGIRIPDELALVGVDNDESICENMMPTITSVSFDDSEVPDMTAAALAALMVKPRKHKAMKVLVAPKKVVRRASTMRFERSDAEVMSALDLIRQQACSGLTAEQVTRGFSCSRRMAELRFRRLTGKTILQSIIDVRLELAHELLKDRSLSRTYIANRCGYSSWVSLYLLLRAKRAP